MRSAEESIKLYSQSDLDAAVEKGIREGWEAAREMSPRLDRPVFGYGGAYEMRESYATVEDYLRAKGGGKG